LVVAEFLRVLLRLTRQCQTFWLLTKRADTARIEFGYIAHALAYRDARLLGHRQDDLGIAQVEQAALAGLFQNILGERQVPAPAWDCGDPFTLPLPSQVAHRNVRKTRQTLDDVRMRGDTPPIALPDFGVGRRIDYAPATLAPTLEELQHSGFLLVGHFIFEL